jgi:hypothetical protein
VLRGQLSRSPMVVNLSFLYSSNSLRLLWTSQKQSTILNTLTLLGGLSDTGDNTPCSDADTGLFDNVLVGEDPA